MIRVTARARPDHPLTGGLRPISLVLLSIAVAGCTVVGPDYVSPEVELASEWSSPVVEGLSASEAEIVDWWTQFDDPVLDDLVTLAQAHNNSLEIAGLNVLAARAQLGIASGLQWPQSQALAADAAYVSPADGSLSPPADWQFTVGASVAWEIDFWGRYARGIEAANASLLSEMAAYEDALVLVTGLVVDTYTTIRVLEERLRIADQNIERQHRSFEITDVLFRNGEASELDMQQARRQLLGTQSTVPELEATMARARHALAALLGQPPGTIEAKLVPARPIPDVPERIAVGIPADLVRRRPDVRRAEYLAMAQNALVGVAVTDLYPRFTLTGTLGSTSGFPGGGDVGDLFDASSITWQAGLGLVWPFLNYGRIKNSIRVEDARLQQALVNYDETVLQATREAEDAMAAFVGGRRQLEILDDTVEAAERSNDLAVIRYREGFSDFQRVIDSQQALFSAQERFLTTKGSTVRSLVDLFTAIAGGWEIGDDAYVAEATERQMRERTDWGDYFDDHDDEAEP